MFLPLLHFISLCNSNSKWTEKNDSEQFFTIKFFFIVVHLCWWLPGSNGKRSRALLYSGGLLPMQILQLYRQTMQRSIFLLLLLLWWVLFYAFTFVAIRAAHFIAQRCLPTAADDEFFWWRCWCIWWYLCDSICTIIQCATNIYLLISNVKWKRWYCKCQRKPNGTMVNQKTEKRLFSHFIAFF